MIFQEIVTKAELIELFSQRGIASESTVHKLASGNCPGRGFEGFPIARLFGATRAWKRVELESWVASRFSSPETIEKKLVVHPGSGRGRPSRREKIAAMEAGMSVKEWRAKQVLQEDYFVPVVLDKSLAGEVL